MTRRSAPIEETANAPASASRPGGESAAAALGPGGHVLIAGHTATVRGDADHRAQPVALEALRSRRPTPAPPAGPPRPCAAGGTPHDRVTGARPRRPHPGGAGAPRSSPERSATAARRGRRPTSPVSAADAAVSTTPRSTSSPTEDGGASGWREPPSRRCRARTWPASGNSVGRRRSTPRWPARPAGRPATGSFPSGTGGSPASAPPGGLAVRNRRTGQPGGP